MSRTIMFEQYQPLPGVNVRVRSRQFVQTVVTSSDGAFKIDGIPPGRYNVEASLASVAPWRLRLDPPPGTQVSLAINMVAHN